MSELNNAEVGGGQMCMLQNGYKRSVLLDLMKGVKNSTRATKTDKFFKFLL